MVPNSCEESFQADVRIFKKVSMKTTTSKRVPEHVRALLTAGVYIVLVMTLTYISWFASR